MTWSKGADVHRNHLAPCLVLFALAVALLVAIGPGLAAVGTAAVLVLCPLAMGGVVWWLARSHQREQP